MDRGSASINVTPSPPGEEMGVEISSTSVPRLEHKHHYEFGFRQMGDDLFDFKTNEYTWDSPQNVELTLRCNAEANHRISFVQMKVDQSSAFHDAKIIDGAIGTDYVEILVTARFTKWLKYEMRIFGNDNLVHVPLKSPEHN